MEIMRVMPRQLHGTLYSIGKKKSQLNIQAHLALRASAPKELSLPHRHPNNMINLILIM